MAEHTATVEVLTAEVRVLMVGSRQVTLSVYSQLDLIDDDRITPFGRVSARSNADGYVYVIGPDDDGVLSRARLPQSQDAIRRAVIRMAPSADERQVASLKWELLDHPEKQNFFIRSRWAGRQDAIEFIASHSVSADMIGSYEWRLESGAREWLKLPLIVLAGLR